ncbi:hypothetical protein VTJ04DRAFT_7364 [Mycothermus thermophilus]|uniref:uncharacterized protein n=1 Tax=Humicola insolens TaxID=85995 RepID=UPI0037442A10
MTARSAEASTSALGGIGKPAPSFELETDPIDKTTVQHHFYRRDPRSSSGRRRVTETWVRETVLSSSPSSSVWLERCDDVERQGPSLRVVKKIMIAPEAKFDGHRELEAIFAFSHDKYEPYFVKAYGWFQIDDAMFLAMEYVPYGDLRNLTEPCPEHQATKIARQLLSGLKYLHEDGFAHHDLEPESSWQHILIASPGPDWLVQISGFGLGRRLRGDENDAKHRTPCYAAPELLGIVSGGEHPLAADLWSLGCVVYQVLTGVPALKDVKHVREFVNGSFEFPVKHLQRVGVSATGTDFVQQLLTVNPEKTWSWARSSKLLRRKFGLGMNTSDSSDDSSLSASDISSDYTDDDNTDFDSDDSSFFFSTDNDSGDDADEDTDDHADGESDGESDRPFYIDNDDSDKDGDSSPSSSNTESDTDSGESFDHEMLFGDRDDVRAGRAWQKSVRAVSGPTELDPLGRRPILFPPVNWSIESSSQDTDLSFPRSVRTLCVTSHRVFCNGKPTSALMRLLDKIVVN